MFFIKFANILKESSDVEIVIVGDGSNRVALAEKLSNFENVSFYYPVAYNELSNLLCSADLHILFQKNNVIDTVMPSKILAMMASQKPSLITGNIKSEVYSIINKSKAGEYFNYKEINKIIQFVNELKLDKDLLEKYGKNARKYVSNNFSKKEVLKKFEKAFIEL